MTDNRAGWEDIWKGDDIPPRYRTLAAPNENVVAWADGLPDGARVLDIGCGVGRHLVYLAGRGFRVAGVDVSPTGIRLSTEACAERGIPFDGKVGDMQHLDWQDATFDGVFAIATIHHHRRAGIARALDEVLRVLKPGGSLLADFPHTGTLMYRQCRAQVAEGLLTEVEPNTFVNEGPPFDDGDDSFLPHHFCDEADLRDLFRAFAGVTLTADLRDVTTEDGTQGKTGKWVVRAAK